MDSPVGGGHKIARVGGANRSKLSPFNPAWYCSSGRAGLSQNAGTVDLCSTKLDVIWGERLWRSFVDLREVMEDTATSERIAATDPLRQFCRHDSVEGSDVAKKPNGPCARLR